VPLDLAAPQLVFLGQLSAGGAKSEPHATDAHGSVAEQIHVLLWRLGATLVEHELTFDDLLRLRLFVGDMDELPAIAQAMSLEEVQWPAVSVIELPAPGRGERAVLTLDAVAAPGAHAQRRLRHAAALDQSGNSSEMTVFHRSARFGPWVFLSAISAVNGGRPSAHRRSPPHIAPRRVHEESRMSFARMEELLREQDAELRDVVKVGGWLTFPIRRPDYQPLGDVRDALVAEAGLFPASAAIQVGRVNADGALLAFEAIAFAPEDPVERERWRAASLPPPSPLAPYYASARSAGSYVFTCGEVPTGTSGADRPAPVETQAGEVYERLGADLAAHGASSANVLHQTVFVRHLRDRDAVADAARAFFGNDVQPPTTLLAAADIGFHSGCDVEIELVAAADGQ
jgi:enamine deaminase RidA (YjgF/YER057c/UK114 family)